MRFRVCSRVAVLVSLSLVLAVPVSAQGFPRTERVPGGAAVEAAPGHGVAEKAAFIALYDDGDSDFHSRMSATTFEVAMLFENVGGPDVTLGAVQFCWRQDGGDPMIRYEVVLWAPDGPGGAPGTELAKFAAVATGVTPAPAFYWRSTVVGPFRG